MVNWKAGLLGLYVPFFVSLGIWWQFDYGMIFNIINTGIFIPLFIYSLIKLFIDYKKWRIIPVISLILVVSLFHTSGIYLLPSLFIILSAYLWVVYKKQKMNWGIFYILLVCIAISIGGTYQLWHQTQNLLPSVNYESFGGELFPLGYYISGISAVSILLIISAVYFLYKKQIELQVKVFLYTLLILVVVLLVATLGISPSPDRQLFDMITIVALIACALVGSAMRVNKAYSIMAVGLVIVGLSINIVGWFSYRNTIQLEDLEAFNYMQSLDAKTFNCSSEISPIIYSQYIKETFTGNDPDIIIYRSKAMTPCSDRESIAYVPHFEVPIKGYQLIKELDDKIQIKIYIKIGY
jgi:hypothetical protein